MLSGRLYANNEPPVWPAPSCQCPMSQGTGTPAGARHRSSRFPFGELLKREQQQRMVSEKVMILFIICT